MKHTRTIKTALISVFDKQGLEPIVKKLNELGVKILSTGGTEKFIKDLNIDVIPVEDITNYPSILGGRVKTLHPKVFGGILNRQNIDSDIQELKKYQIPQIDLVIVDLYPFEKTVSEGASEQEIIEKIDIGGISLIRAGAKNFRDVLCVASMEEYEHLLKLLEEKKGETDLNDRKYFATKAFQVSSHYDTAIFNYFNQTEEIFSLNISENNGQLLRYGENPHQKGFFFGDFDSVFNKLHGKEISYNNLLDIDSAVNLIKEFKDDAPTFAILKHNNACGVATRNTLKEAYIEALAGDPVSAFGGVLITNKPIDEETAKEINNLFCEVVITPKFEEKAFKILSEKKNRILLELKNFNFSNRSIRTCLNGILVQEKDNHTDNLDDLQFVTHQKPTKEQISDLIFASKICKHTKSNTIVLVKNQQLLGSGTGQTSRVDALRHAIEKAESFNFDLQNSAMASDAFFPFPDCVEIATKAGIKSIIQPGGSIKDQLSIDYCNENNVPMVFTGIRHFKH